MSNQADGLHRSALGAAPRAQQGLSTGTYGVDEELPELCLIAEDWLFDPTDHCIILRYVILQRISRQGNLQAVSNCISRSKYEARKFDRQFGMILKKRPPQGISIAVVSGPRQGKGRKTGTFLRVFSSRMASATWEVLFLIRCACNAAAHLNRQTREAEGRGVQFYKMDC